MILFKCEECGAIYEGEIMGYRIRDKCWFDCEICGEILLEGQLIVCLEARLIVMPVSEDLVE